MTPANHNGNGHPKNRNGWGFTPRELTVLKLRALGNSYKEIANELNLSTHTVDTYIQRIHTLLGVHNSAGVTAFAAEAGLLGPNIVTMERTQ